MATNPLGEEQFWITGTPIEGLTFGSNDAGTQKYWFSGLTEETLFAPVPVSILGNLFFTNPNALNAQINWQDGLPFTGVRIGQFPETGQNFWQDGLPSEGLFGPSANLSIQVNLPLSAVLTFGGDLVSAASAAPRMTKDATATDFISIGGTYTNPIWSEETWLSPETNDKQLWVKNFGGQTATGITIDSIGTYATWNKLALTQGGLDTGGQSLSLPNINAGATTTFWLRTTVPSGQSAPQTITAIGLRLTWS